MKTMTLMGHFVELRRRILWTFLIFLGAFVLGWYVAPWGLTFITSPLLRVWPDGKLLYTGITDGLMIRLSLSLVVGIIVTLPVGLWHLWAFISPGLHANERRFIWPLMIASPVLFIIGATFAFYFLFPFVFRFFIELNESTTVPTMIMPAARDYLAFALRMLRVFGIAFQLPLIMVLLNRIGILSRGAAVAMRRYAFCGIVVIAAVLTPPDVVSQIMLAIPMCMLFEGGILFMRRD
ncbi:MAG: twin-arginine translocase subunit TatC [Alphaproteobacteria bacterium]|nr:twin-arginine translocase subunit TatC [Alphaproteobacteria bacterium]